MKKLLWGIVPMLMLAAVACGGDEEIKFPDNPNQEEPKPDPKPEPEPLPEVEKFYKGTTMSFANYLIDFGLVYRENGEETNPYKSVKAHGANIVRLQLDRVAFNEINGVTIDWQQWERVVDDAKCAKAEGLDIMLTLKPDYDKYSSTTAQHNNIPEDWKALDENTLGGELYKWVYDTLIALHNEGIDPAIVAVGNEVNIGFLLNGGHDGARTARLLNYGHNAVRDYARDCDVAVLSAVHIANPSKIGYVDTYKDAGCTNYDIIALSWYPGTNIGHSMGSYATFKALGEAMMTKHGKRIMVLETAHSFTTGTVNGTWMGDWCDNSYNYPDWNDATNATNYTPAKQRAWLKALAEIENLLKRYIPGVEQMRTKLKKYDGAFKEMKQEKEALLKQINDSKESTLTQLATLQKLRDYEDLRRTVDFVPTEILEAARQLQRINHQQTVETIAKGE